MNVLQEVVEVLKIALGVWAALKDDDFKAKSLPAREKLRTAKTAEEARDASREIHRLLGGGT